MFITELRRLTGLDSADATAAAQQEERELRLNRDLATGSIVSSRHWLDDQLGIDSSDLCWAEQDKLRGRVGHQRALYSECLRDHKEHDAFVSPDSAGRPVVPVECRCWRLWRGSAKALGSMGVGNSAEVLRSAVFSIGGCQ